MILLIIGFTIAAFLLFLCLGAFVTAKVAKEQGNTQYYKQNLIGFFVLLLLAIGIILLTLYLNGTFDDTSYESYTPSNQTTSFTNKYGTSTTKCVVSGCDNYIAKSGDTNCCTKHSNRCGNCNCYIDGDAIFCMKCLEEALGY